MINELEELSIGMLIDFLVERQAMLYGTQHQSMTSRKAQQADFDNF